MHLAVITRTDQSLINTTCPSATSIQAAGGKYFDIHCGEYNTGVNITSAHTQNITACLDACAGNENCNTTSMISKQTSSTYALLSDAPPPSNVTRTNETLPPSSSSSSNAWIAGPVVGGFSALVIIAFAIFWWRRRNPNNATNDHTEEPAFVPVPEKYGHVFAQLDGQLHPSELSDGNAYAHELPTKSNWEVGDQITVQELEAPSHQEMCLCGWRCKDSCTFGRGSGRLGDWTPFDLCRARRNSRLTIP
ncbi:hypothetical protein M011DRAFT_460440 [Sporormia fimetaria CBS 119925]|uniref:Apple domain-containing protein n=1 Tax=Sporormia fimetaria CBS 119925 TaxID=1340428 RepID=A0A6A6V5E8_9PLEO|nr:hypothetical protein M011DRAFT_460440 [Sporormia fimetaria CBS 119925]